MIDQREPSHLYRIAADDQELYFGWTTPARARQLLTEYRQDHPTSKLIQLSSDTIEGFWATPRTGDVLHFWTSETQTLCQNPDLKPRWGKWKPYKVQGRCLACKRKLRALEAEAKKEASQ